MCGVKDQSFPVLRTKRSNAWNRLLGAKAGHSTKHSYRENWSDRKTTLTPMSHNRGGFVGAYVCERCLRSCDGVYLVREEQSWLCGACKTGVATKQEQPAQLRWAMMIPAGTFVPL